MAVRNPLYIPIPHRGLMPHLNQREIGPEGLYQSENWVLRDGVFQVRPGSTVFGNDINQRATGYIQYRHSDAALRTVKGTIAGWWKYAAGTDLFTDITGTALTATAVQQQVFRVFQKAGATWLLGINSASSKSCLTS